MWFPTIWIYLFPFDLDTNFWQKPLFWVGLLFVTFPLNFMVYGLNDFTDQKADKFNKRKGNYLFGSRLCKKELSPIPRYVFFVMMPFLIFFTYIKGVQIFVLLMFMIAVNIIYNYKPFRIKERPPFEIFIQIGYVFTVLFSILLNDLKMIHWQTLLYLTLFAFQAYIAGEIMDIEPDREAKKKTTATLIGRRKTKLLMLFILLIEAYILIFWFNDFILSSFLAAFAFWLILDIFIFFKNKPYSLKQMMFFGIAINICAFLSIIWILYSGNLLYPNF